MIKKILIILSLLYHIFFIISKEYYKIKDGFLDLTNFDFDKKYIKLSGKWAYYNNIFLDPQYVSVMAPQYIYVPKVINPNNKISPFGKGTYQLKIKLKKDKDRFLTIKIGRILSNYKLYINDQLVKEVGKVGKSYEESKNSFEGTFYTFKADDEELLITIQFSNFVEWTGSGILKPIYLGKRDILTRQLLHMYIEIFLSGLLFMTGLSQLILFILRRKEKLTLILSIFTFLLSIRTFFTGDINFYNLFDDKYWSLIYRIELFTLIIISISGTYFAYILFDIMNKNVIAFFIVYYIFSSFLVIFLPDNLFVFPMVIFYISVIIVSIYFYTKLFLNLNKNFTDKIIFIIGFTIQQIFITHDILYVNGLPLLENHILIYGNTIFAISQVLLLSLRFVKSYKKIEINQEIQQLLNKSLEEKLNLNKRELKKTQYEKQQIFDELIRNQKLESLGLLASNLAHDLNNILTIIQGNAYFIKYFINKKIANREINSDENHINEIASLENNLNNIEKAIVRANELSNKLITFSKGGKPIIKNIVITDFLNKILTNFETTYGIKINSNLYFDQSIKTIEGDENQLFIAITNILNNSYEALSDKFGENVIEKFLENTEGKIKTEEKTTKTVKITKNPEEKTEEKTKENHENFEHKLSQNTLQTNKNEIATQQNEKINITINVYTKNIDKKYLIIEIIDNGIGIQKNIIDNIFDPFFSTKKNKSGLGLTIAHSIIKQHNGSIFVDSNNTQTKFTIYLPYIQNTDEKNIEENKKLKDEIFRKSQENYPQFEEINGKNRKIMIIDDEIEILSFLNKYLKSKNFITYSVQNYEDFKYYIDKLDEKPQIYIVDLIIQNSLYGIEIVKEIRKNDKYAYIIVSSGYSNNDIISNYKNYEINSILKKPYNNKDLDIIIKTAIEEVEKLEYLKESEKQKYQKQKTD